MAKSRAAIGLGTEFFIGTESGSPIGIDYTSITEAATINFADYTVAEVDVTHLLSPDSTEETIAGLRKTGTIEVSGNYVGDAAQQSIDTLAQARTEFPWKITSPLSGARVLTVTGRGFINKRETGPFTPGGKTEFKFGVKVAGTLVYAIA
jgi:Lambda phage tail tube protein, TTP